MYESFRRGSLWQIATSAPWYLRLTAESTLPWLIRLRWTTAAIGSVVVLAAIGAEGIDLPLRRVAGLVALVTLANALSALWVWRGRAVPPVVAGIGLLLDVALLTGLLELTGGPFNPFVVVYAVHIILAAVAINASAAASMVAAVATACGLLIYWHTREQAAGHHRLNDIPTHAFMLWVAIGSIAELAMRFMTRASDAVARREAELEVMRRRAAQTDKLISLSTLAAGAAHELSTPLATIAVAARELEHAIEANAAKSLLLDDARLIRLEVAHCEVILDHMSGRAGGRAADQPEPVDVADVLGQVARGLARDRASRVIMNVASDLPPLHVPPVGFRRVVLSLLDNAFDASTREQCVSLVAELGAGGESVRVSIKDEGHGMASEVLQRAGEPFYTTKPAGQGRGLGLFLARTFAERLGGHLALRSDRGTDAILELPLRAHLPESR